MKIEEVLKLYEFLSDSGWFGILTVWFIVNALIIGSIYFMGKEKVDLHKPKWKIQMASVVGIVTISLLGLTIEASNRNELLKLANCIKSEYIKYGYKEDDNEDILENFHCRKCKDTIRLVKADLDELLSKHPSEFLRVITDDGSLGIRMIEPSAVAVVDKYNLFHLPFMKAKILDYMHVAGHTDSLTYREVRDSIDDYFDDEWIELMLSRYDSLFTPYSLKGGNKKYGNSHGFKLNKEIKAQWNEARKERKTKLST